MTGFSIIGAGRLGVCLGRALTERGLSLKYISDKDPRKAREGRRMIGRGRATSDNAKAALAARDIFISVPDDSIAAVARDMARRGGCWRDRHVFHTSGIMPARLLAPLKDKGAWIASLHPVQSFPDQAAPTRLFKRITWGIEGDGEALRAGEELIRRLGGNVLRLAASDKAVYHTACSLASNAVAALAEMAACLLEETGLGKAQAEAVLLPLRQGTLQNVKNFGLEKALTGPLVRGDLETVRLHQEVLAKYPDIATLYRGVALWALERATGAGLTPARIRALRRLLQGGRPLPRGASRIPDKRAP